MSAFLQLVLPSSYRRTLKLYRPDSALRLAQNRSQSALSVKTNAWCIVVATSPIEAHSSIKPPNRPRFRPTHRWPFMRREFLFCTARLQNHFLHFGKYIHLNLRNISIFPNVFKAIRCCGGYLRKPKRIGQLLVAINDSLHKGLAL